MGDEGLTAVTCKSPSNSLRIPSLSFSSDSSELPITSLLSPPIIDSPQIEEEQGNFYVLEKDSLRRTYIVKVLYDNAECIGEIWMNVLTQKTPEIVLKMDHLKVLLDGLREFIPEQNRIPLQQAISQLKEDLEFDGVAVNHMHLALYVFQDAVKYVLKQQNIMPHWVFSLDNLVRSSVQAAISILSPELGDNLEGKNYENEVKKITFGVPTTNSTKSLLNTPLYIDAEIVQLQQKNERLIQENIKLMKKQIAANEACQILLKKCIEEKTTHVNLLEFVFLQNTSNPGTHSSSNFVNYDSDTLINNDFKELHEWLKEIGVDEESIKMFADQMYTKDDVLTLMTREDLRHLRLRGGIELKIWHHIVNHRKQTA